MQKVFLASLSILLAKQVGGYSFPDCDTSPLKGNAVCDTSKDPFTRAKAIVDLFTVDELINNTINTSPGVARLGLPSYQWWSEGLVLASAPSPTFTEAIISQHGVAASPGVTFSAPGTPFSYATSFPQPILMSAAFDDDLIMQVATVVSTEARAFNNEHQAGLDFWTPNINPFKDPRWGRGQETPGEDPFHVSQYVYQLIQGLQGGLDPEPYLKIVATCKHFAAYDLDNWEGIERYSFDAIVSQQDLSEYYLPSFQSCVRDAKVASVMCSYNAVNGIPSCADTFLLQDILRDHWGFGEDRWVTSDCDAVGNVFTDHDYTDTFPEAVAATLKAGTDIDCGGSYTAQLPAAFNQNLITQQDLQTALTRQYISLVRLGYFDPASAQPYRQLGWDDVSTTSAQSLAYQAAVEGIVLLKNSVNSLPLSSSIKSIALIGPWANATGQMQGNYFGTAPYLISPLQAATAAGYSVQYVLGTTITGTDDSGFEAAVTAASNADAVIFAGGIDTTVEAESLDRDDITWPSNQVALINTLLDAVGGIKPFVVVQFGGGQLDDSALAANDNVTSIVWAGYPGQSGGTALFDILRGKAAPAGRLPITQYPADYTSQIPMTDMSLRPNATTGSPGRTYKWYNQSVFDFGFGLHYTNFSASLKSSTASSVSVNDLVSSAKADAGSNPTDRGVVLELTVDVSNEGDVQSDYVALVFLKGTFGPSPNPLKQLVGYERVKSVPSKGRKSATVRITLGNLARADESGNTVVYSGDYEFVVDVDEKASVQLSVTGDMVQILGWPSPST